MKILLRTFLLSKIYIFKIEMSLLWDLKYNEDILNAIMKTF